MPHLHALRRSHGLTILEIAQRSGLSARAIAELEYGLRPLEDAARLALARSYDLAPADLETPLAGPVSLSWGYLAKILSLQLIFATLLSTLMVVLLFGGAIYGAESHTRVPSARALDLVDGLGSHLSNRYLFAATAHSRPRPDTPPPHHSLERAILAVAPTTTPTATPRPRPSATPWPAPTEMPSPVPAEAPSPVPTAMPRPASTEVPNLVPTGAPSPMPSEMPSPMPTDAPSPMPSEAPSSAPTGAPSPMPSEAPSPGSGAVTQSNSVFMPLEVEGSFHQNVVAALEANNGALQHVVIPPNGVWSFNRTVGDPNLLTLEPVYGIYGGG